MTREEIREHLSTLDELQLKLDELERRMYERLVRASREGYAVPIAVRGEE